MEKALIGSTRCSSGKPRQDRLQCPVFLICSMLVGLTMPAFAFAEEALIEEVVVTAQKREQKLEDISIAVTALTDSDIIQLGLAEPVDLAAQVPNLNINNTIGNSIPNVSIRGIGLNDYAVNNNPAAGVYVDEVYLVSPAMLSFQLFDLERVEVLKGPQGTLYGRNTTAGAVNFVSNKPSDEFEGRLAAAYGNFDSVMMEGAAGGELAPGFKGRVAVKGVYRNKGHQTNRATNQDVGEIDRTSWRLLIDMQPAEDIDILLNIHGGRDESDTLLVKVDNILTPTDDAFFSGNPFSSAGRPDTYVDNKSNGGALTVKWDIYERLALTSVTGYEKYSRHHVEDRDGTELEQLDGKFLNDIKQVSQEVRITYGGDRLVLIAGAFYGADKIETRDRFDTEQLFSAGIFPFRSVGNEYSQKTNSWATYAHSEWMIDNQWRLTAGLRYTNEEKDFDGAFTFIYVDAPPTAGGTELQVFPPVANDYDVSDVSGKIGLDYLGVENTLLYANIGKGFKSGSFQGQLTFLPQTLANFEEENVIAYEAGLKTRLLNGNVQLNVAAFYYDYDDIQIYGSIYTEPIDPLFGIDNAGDAKVLGMEAELLWRTQGGLELRAGLGLLDTEITKSILPTIKKGSKLPNSPKVNFNFLARYQWGINQAMAASVITDASYKGDVTYDIVRQPGEVIEDGYWLINARVGLVSNNETWSAYLWVRNLADEEYRAQVLTSTVGFGESWGLPRTYGLTLEYNW